MPFPLPTDAMTGLNVHFTHPDTSQDDISIPLLETSWQSGEIMAPAIDVIHTLGDGSSRRLRCSRIKKLIGFPLGPVRSDGGLFGILRSKPGTDVKGFCTNDPLVGSDNEILNALDFPLYDSEGVEVSGPFYRVQGRIVRAWIFQAKRTTTPPVPPGSWTVSSVSAEWSIGPWNIYDLFDQKAAEKPQPPVESARFQSVISAVNFAAPHDTWQAQANFRDFTYNFFNVNFAPNANVGDLFTGPNTGFAGVPIAGDTYESEGMLALTASIAPYTYDCGTVRWTVIWTFV
jgi:hypothetical protein